MIFEDAETRPISYICPPCSLHMVTVLKKNIYFEQRDRTSLSLHCNVQHTYSNGLILLG